MLVRMNDGSVLVSDNIVCIKPIIDIISSNLSIGTFYSKDKIEGLEAKSHDNDNGYCYDRTVESKIYKYGVEIFTNNNEITFKYMFVYQYTKNVPTEVILEKIQLEADSMCKKFCNEIMPNKRLVKLDFRN